MNLGQNFWKGYVHAIRTKLLFNGSETMPFSRCSVVELSVWSIKPDVIMLHLPFMQSKRQVFMRIQ
ncbi:unnamed protein product [Protopolystoma xenopodis]|uniref:Uncharacterized protein n=1 Tax=Protopolystoma xenopodis TaxID=117903 RepID=A0A3S5A603_9PLAT|nr:unnamed protein product [Protopolystoma xenopodis]